MRYGIISDIHANLAALQAVLTDLGSVDALWCLGDVVGYGPDPNPCVEIVRQQVQVCIPGNHDWASIGKIGVKDFNDDAARACLWTQQQLSPANADFLAGLPQTRQEGDFTLAHGSPGNPIWEYVLSASHARAQFDRFPGRYCLVGHTHIPMIFQKEEEAKGRVRAITPQANHPFSLEKGRMIINPGSVGQPRDGRPEAAYAILDTDKALIEHRRVAYPIEETQNRMVQAGLSPKHIVRLGYGW